MAKHSPGFVQVEQDVRATWPRDLDGKTNDFQLVAVMARRKPDLAAHLVALDTRRLIGLAKSCAALSVASCNRGLSDRQEKRWQKLGAQIAEIAGWYGMSSSHHGDPRGFVVRVDGPGVPKSSWGDGMGVA
jgi:hypothetical protein